MAVSPDALRKNGPKVQPRSVTNRTIAFTGHRASSVALSTMLALAPPPNYPRDQSTLPLLKRIQVFISRVRLQKGQAKQRVRLPITPPTLCQIKTHLMASNNPNRMLLWVVATSVSFVFFRLGELLPESVKAFAPTTGLS